MNKCIFLDRDGVLNVERGDYTYKTEDFLIEEGVKEALEIIKKNNFLAIIITNQAGISRDIYTREMMHLCHEKLLKEVGRANIDDIFYCPYHPTISNSINRKPDNGMIQRAIALYNIDPSLSWIIGDSERDITAGHKSNLKAALVSNKKEIETKAEFTAPNLLGAVRHIFRSQGT